MVLHLNKNIVFIHLAGWVGFAFYEQSVVFITGTTQFDLLQVLINYVLNAGLFYGSCAWLLPQLYPRRQYAAYIWAPLALLLVYSFLRVEANIRLFPLLGVAAPPYSYARLWVLAVYRGVFFQLIGVGYWFAYHTVKLEQQKRHQQKLLLIAENNLIEANLAFLKSQINPHFLFNSLNFLYAQVYPLSENAARGLLLLSEIMRYALRENSEGKVMLNEEVKHLYNYISINQLRFSNNLQVDFAVTGNTHLLMILPLVLISLVENCFKHGELCDSNYPVVIHLAVVDNHLTFHTHNKKRLGPKEKATSIGLLNIKRQLQMIYADRHNLQVDDTNDFYTCTLTILL